MLITLIENLQNLPPVAVGGSLLVVSWICLTVAWRFWGVGGLFVYSAVAVLVANFQVLKVAQYAFWDTPIAMGTAVFSTIFLSGQIITQQYGTVKAKESIALSVFAQAMVTALMLITIGVRPESKSIYSLHSLHNELSAVFLPAPALFIAGVIALFVGQFYDVVIFQKIRQISSGRFLWLRSAAGFLVGSLLDSVIFNLLAWRFLASNPIPWDVLFTTYLFGTYVLRLMFGLMNIPVLYGISAWANARMKRES
jgi:queuosine precursor transporter